ncbi:MAG: nucleotide exchange factor GrpE [Planctomycetota bacterium]
MTSSETTPPESEACADETAAGDGGSTSDAQSSDAQSSDAQSSDAQSGRSEPAGDAGDAPTVELPAELQEIVSMDASSLIEMKTKAEERDTYRDELLRAKAELDNHQKRVRRDRPVWEDQAVRRFVAELLPVLDNFELALSSSNADSDALRTGVEMIQQLLQKVLTDHGVEEVPAAGEAFDPEVHEAVAMVQVPDTEPGKVFDVQQRGFSFKGVLIRPSRVMVAAESSEQRGESKPAEAEESAGEDEGNS